MIIEPKFDIGQKVMVKYCTAPWHGHKEEIITAVKAVNDGDKTKIEYQIRGQLIPEAGIKSIAEFNDYALATALSNLTWAIEQKCKGDKSQAAYDERIYNDPLQVALREIEALKSEIQRLKEEAGR